MNYLSKALATRESISATEAESKIFGRVATRLSELIHDIRSVEIDRDERRELLTVYATAHLVRDYRNALVHEREDKPDVVPIDNARSYLCHFFSYLPPRW